MSSLRNAVKRVTHKERSQPTARANLGILEKKKDYRLRSKDYHRKKDALRNLKTKAAMRNPDEFYFGMNNSKLQDGRHRKLEAAKAKEREHLIGPEAVKLMKSQDLSYVRMQIMKDMKKVERLKSSLHLLDESSELSGTEQTKDGNTKPRRKHTIFVDTVADAKNFDVAEHFETIEAMAGRTFNRPRKEMLIHMAKNDQNMNLSEELEQYDDATIKKIRKREDDKKRIVKATARKAANARAASYREMHARQNRIELLRHAEAHLVTEKIVASKGQKRKIKAAQNGKPALYKFSRKRMR